MARKSPLLITVEFALIVALCVLAWMHWDGIGPYLLGAAGGVVALLSLTSDAWLSVFLENRDAIRGKKHYDKTA